MKRIAIIGTNGVPAKYGGFETLVENLVSRLSKKFRITVVCSSVTNDKSLKRYKNVDLIYVPLNANGWQSVPFDMISILKTVKNHDKILILGASGCLILPFLSKYERKFIFLFGGLDWKRSKWNYLAKKTLKISEKIGINRSPVLISDNVGIQKYVRETYGRESHIIEYGGDQAFSLKPSFSYLKKYPFLSFDYYLCVARIQKDNNIEMILNSIDNSIKSPLVLIGNWNFSNYGRDLKIKYANKKNVILLDAIYEPDELNTLRSNCSIYIHGHSCGGTNPALVEAMFLKIPIFAHNNIFNKETTKYSAAYFRNEEELNALFKEFSSKELKDNSIKMYEIAKENYRWRQIVSKYEVLFSK